MRKMPTHIVAVGGLVTDGEGRVLLVRSPRRGWEFPGGQVENGESLTEALRREIREESGVEARVTGFVGLYSRTKERPGYNGVDVIPTIVNIDFRCEYVSGDVRPSEESPEVGWFSPEEALGMVTHSGVRKRLSNMIEGRGVVHIGAYPDIDRWAEEFGLPVD